MATDKIKQALKQAIEQAKAEKQHEDGLRREAILQSIKGDLGQAFAPFLEEIKNSSKMSAEELKRIISESVKVEVPAQDVTPITNAIFEAFKGVSFPEAKTPVVNVAPPIVNVPDIKMPDKMNVEGWVSLMGVDVNHPLPVQLRDQDGKPVSLAHIITGGGGGGKSDFFTIKGFDSSAYSNLQNADGRLRVSVETGGSGLTDTELRASSVPVEQVSGSQWSVSVKEIFGSAITSLLNGDNRIPVSVETGGSGLTDSELRASSVPVAQASGANWSVYVTDVFKTTVASDVPNGDNRLKVSVESGSTGLTDSELRATAVPVSQVSGASWSVVVNEIFGSTGSNAFNPDGRIKVELPGNTITVDGSGVTQPVSATDLDIRDLLNASDSISAYQVSGHRWSTEATQSGTWNIGTVTTVTGITNTVAAANVDSTGVQYSGSNPMPTYLVAGSGNSTISVGDLASDAVDTGSAPVKIGGIARQANPTAVAAGDRVSATFDDLGRQLTRPIQVRDLMRTAYATLTNGTETSLLAGVASTFHDLIYVMGANNSDAAVTVDLRASTGGNIVSTLSIPANGTVGFSLPVPMVAPFTGHTWTADMGDITGTTVYLTALFSAEV